MMRTNYSCEKCGKGGFANRHSLRNHIARCSKDDTKTASRGSDSTLSVTNYSRSGLNDRNALRHHDAQCSKDTEQETSKEIGAGKKAALSCPVCPHTAVSKTKLAQHMKNQKCKVLMTRRQDDVVKPVDETVPIDSVSPPSMERISGTGSALSQLATIEEERLQDEQPKQTNKAEMQLSLKSSVQEAMEIDSSDDELASVFHQAAVGESGNRPVTDDNEDIVAFSPRRSAVGLRPSPKFMPVCGFHEWEQRAFRVMGIVGDDVTHDFKFPAKETPWDRRYFVPDDLVRIVGDGNCFYRAVSWWIAKDEKHHGQVRKAFAAYMAKDPLGTLRSHLRMSVKEYAQYVATVAEDGKWATTTEIIAMSEVLRVPIWTFVHPRGGAAHWNAYTGFKSDKSLSRQAIYLENKGVHFDVVVSVKVHVERRLLVEGGTGRRSATKKRTPPAHCSSRLSGGKQTLSGQLKMLTVSPPSVSPMKKKSRSSGLDESDLSADRSLNSSRRSNLFDSFTSDADGNLEDDGDDIVQMSPLKKMPDVQMSSSRSSGRKKRSLRLDKSAMNKSVKKKSKKDTRYRQNNPSAVKRKNLGNYLTRDSSIKKNRRQRYCNMSSTKKRIYKDEQKKARSRRYERESKAVGAFGSTANDRRIILKQRRRTMRLAANKFLGDNDNQTVSSRSEKAIVSRITEMLVSAMRRDYKQQCVDSDCNQLTAWQLQKKILLFRTRTLGMVRQRVVKAREHRRLAWVELSRKLASFKKWFAGIEEEIAKEEKAGCSRKVAIERVLSQGAYHARTAEAFGCDRELKKYFDVELPVVISGQLWSNPADIANRNDADGDNSPAAALNGDGTASTDEPMVVDDDGVSRQQQPSSAVMESSSALMPCEAMEVDSDTAGDHERSQPTNGHASAVFNPVSGHIWHKTAAWCMRLLGEIGYELCDVALGERVGWNPNSSRPIDVRTITGDGNCLFRAMSYVITGAEMFHEQIRRRTTDYMALDPQKFLQPMTGIDDDDEYNRYVQQMAMPLERGTHNEIFAMSEILGTTIWVFTPSAGQSGGDWTPYRYLGAESQRSLDAPAIYLQCVDGHYEVVLSVEQTIVPSTTPNVGESVVGMESDGDGRTDYQSAQDAPKPSCGGVVGASADDDTVSTEKPTAGDDEKKERTAKIRLCDKDCALPPFWSLRLRSCFKKIARCLDGDDGRTNYADVLQTLIVELNSCCGCDMATTVPCTNAVSVGCRNNMKLMRLVQPHFATIRSATRRVYELQALAYYIAGVDRAFARASWKQLAKTMVFDDMPLHLRAALGKRNATKVVFDRANLEADAVAQFGGQIDQFREDICCFPNEVCSLCARIMCSATDRNHAGKNGLGNKLESKDQFAAVYSQHPQMEEMLNLLPDDGMVTLCFNCRDDLSNRVLPRFSALNNMAVDDVPDELLQLNTYERILIQRAKSFLTVVKLQTVSTNKHPTGHLVSALKGSIINLPLSMEETLRHIADNTQTLPAPGSLKVVVESKERLDTTAVRKSMVDLSKVRAALVKLKEINRFYRDISIAGVETPEKPDEDAVELLEQEELAGQSSVLQKPAVPSLTVRHVTVDELLNSDQRSVIKMFDSVPLESDCEHFKAQQITNKPIQDKEKMTDALCFPHLHPRGTGGMFDERPTQIGPTQYMKARLLDHRQRFRKDPQYLFYLTGLSVLREVHHGIFTCTRTGKKGLLTARELYDKTKAVDDEMEQRLGRVLEHVRQSSAYWAQKRSDLRCYDEKYGPATFFLTFSCAEFDWPDMTDYLKWMDQLRKDPQKWKHLGEASLGCGGSDSEGAKATERSAKTRPSDDPVAVMEHFQRRFDALFKNLIRRKDGKGPLGEVDHYFWRVEYQMRGAPHVHMKVWVKDAPVIGKNSNEEVIAFVKGKVTCAMPDPLTCPELHRLVSKYQMHNKCNSSCLRFDRKARTKRCRYGFPRATRASVFVNNAEVITKSRSRRTRMVELARGEQEQRVNDYNPALLLAWKANIDVQFVGESSFVLNNYITNYISKREKTAAREVWEKLDKSKGPYGNLLSLFRQLERSREYGVYECSARLLGQPCFGRSVAVDYLGVGLKSRRRGRLLPNPELKEIYKQTPDSTAVFHSNFIDDYYPNRPDEMENQSLFEVYCNHKYVTNSQMQKMKNVSHLLPLKNGLGFLQKRSERVVKTPNYKPGDDASTEQYFQALLMLFLPWRDEVVDLLRGFDTYKSSFDGLANTPVFDNALKYAEARARIDDAYKLCEKWQNEKADEVISPVMDVDLDDPVSAQPLMPTDEVADDVLLKRPVVLPSQLNDCQRRIFDEVMAAIADGTQIYKMISGVAGTGKSYLIDALVSKLTEEFEGDCPVVITAPTGIAAFNILGTTIHSTFKVPVKNSRTGNAYAPMERNDVKEHRLMWKNTKLFIVDEVSMVSNVSLRIIHMRLSELFGGESTEQPKLFGGRNVLFFGDLLQLKPVKSDFCFASTIGHPSFDSHLDPRVWSGGELSYAELTENMRQRDDPVYADLLGRVRIGSPTAADIGMLQDRRMPKDATKYSDIAALLRQKDESGAKCICLMPYSAQVSEFNDEMLRSTCKEIITIVAKDANILSKGKKRPAKTTKKKGRAADTGGLEDQLVLAKGARVMLRRNLDVGKGLVNGAVGYVTQIRLTNNDVSSIDVKFPTGVATIEKLTVEYEVGHKIWNERTQFPLTLAWAMTIHKSQGVTVDAAIIDLSEACFEAGMAYVALSRVKRLDQVHLIGFHPSVLDCNSGAVAEYCRLRQLATPPLPAIEGVNAIKQNHPRRKYVAKVMVSLEVAAKDDASTSSRATTRTRADRTCVIMSSQQPLENETMTRCFANSVIMCINNLAQLFASDDVSPLYRALKELHSGRSTSTAALLNILNSRLPPADRFSPRLQQDAGEFWLKLFQNLPRDRRQLFEFQRKAQIQCRQCSDVHDGPLESDCFVHLFFDDDSATTLFNAALANSLRSSNIQVYCRNCEQMTAHDQEEQLICGQQFLVIQLDLFFRVTPTEEKRVTNRRISEFDAGRMKIGGHFYRTVGAVLHRGESTKQGHYTAICRSQADPWQLVDDMTCTTGKRRFVSQLDNVYLLFLTLC